MLHWPAVRNFKVVVVVVLTVQECYTDCLESIQKHMFDVQNISHHDIIPTHSIRCTDWNYFVVMNCFCLLTVLEVSEEIAVPAACHQSHVHQGMSQNAHMCTSPATVVLHHFNHDHSFLSGLLIFLFQHPSPAILFYSFEDLFLNKKLLASYK